MEQALNGLILAQFFTARYIQQRQNLYNTRWLSEALHRNNELGKR